MIEIPASAQSASSPFLITVKYYWYGSPSNEYTLSVYSKTGVVPILNSTGLNNAYNMDGKSPSGFIGSSYCGINCIPGAKLT